MRNPNLSCGKKSSQGTKKIPPKTSAPQPRWARPLNTTMDDKWLHTALPEVPRMGKSARPDFVLYIYKMDQMVSKIKTHLAVMLPQGSQRQAHFGEVLQLLTPTSKIPREQAALAAQQIRGDYLCKDSERWWGRDPIFEKASPPATLCWNLEVRVLAKVRVAQEEQVRVQ